MKLDIQIFTGKRDAKVSVYFVAFSNLYKSMKLNFMSQQVYFCQLFHIFWIKFCTSIIFVLMYLLFIFVSRNTEY